MLRSLYGVTQAFDIREKNCLSMYVGGHGELDSPRFPVERMKADERNVRAHETPRTNGDLRLRIGGQLVANIRPTPNVANACVVFTSSTSVESYSRRLEEK